MPSGQNSRKAQRGNKEESTGDEKPRTEKDGHLLKKFVRLRFFSGHSSNIILNEKAFLFEDKKEGLQRRDPKKLKAKKEKVLSLEKIHTGKMCPKCKIIACSLCHMLHTESSFIAHSLLDHYDRESHILCCSTSGLPQDHHVCKKRASEISTRFCLLPGSVTSQY